MVWIKLAVGHCLIKFPYGILKRNRINAKFLCQLHKGICLDRTCRLVARFEKIQGLLVKDLVGFGFRLVANDLPRLCVSHTKMILSFIEESLSMDMDAYAEGV